MADENDRLHARVEELHRRLQAEGGVGDELRHDLMRLLADVDRHLEKAAPAEQLPVAVKPQQPDSLADRLLEAGQKFESTHPVLGTTIGNLADALSRIGI